MFALAHVRTPRTKKLPLEQLPIGGKQGQASLQVMDQVKKKGRKLLLRDANRTVTLTRNAPTLREWGSSFP